MLEISEIVYRILSTSQALIDMGVQVQPVISNQKSKKPLVNYALSEDPSASKDGAFPFNISVRIYTDTYKQSLQIVDAVYQAIGGAPETEFRYLGTQEPQPDVEGELYTETNYSFSFKK